MQPVHARAPVRIDLAGGTLDIWPINLALGQPAVTVNAALDLPVEAHVLSREGGAITLVSEDLGAVENYDDPAALQEALAEGSCRLALLARAVLAVAPLGGLHLRTRSRLPAGSGLGGSSALLSTVLGALLTAVGKPRPPRDIQPLAQDVETALLGTPTGYQDYFPPLLGGCLALERSVGDLRIRTLPVDLDAMAARMRLVYTGEPHESGITNWGVVKAWLEGEAQTVASLDAIAGHAARVRQALDAGDLNAAFEAMLADGDERRRMAPGVTTPGIEALDAAMRAAGAMGTKICGAGGGGCVLVLLPERATAILVDEALAAGPWEVLPLRLTPRGLEVTAATD